VQRGGLEELRQLGLGSQCNAGNTVQPPQPLIHCWWLQEEEAATGYPWDCFRKGIAYHSAAPADQLING